MNWFNEVKIPMLTAAILTDSGQNDIKSKIELYDTLIEAEFNTAPGKAKKLTPEEEFLLISLRSNYVHGKAKVLIYKILKECKTASVMQLYNTMLFRLRKEHPSVVETMIKEGLLWK